MPLAFLIRFYSHQWTEWSATTTRFFTFSARFVTLSRSVCVVPYTHRWLSLTASMQRTMTTHQRFIAKQNKKDTHSLDDNEWSSKKGRAAAMNEQHDIKLVVESAQRKWNSQTHENSTGKSRKKSYTDATHTLKEAKLKRKWKEEKQQQRKIAHNRMFHLFSWHRRAVVAFSSFHLSQKCSLRLRSLRSLALLSMYLSQPVPLVPCNTIAI